MDLVFDLFIYISNAFVPESILPSLHVVCDLLEDPCRVEWLQIADEADLGFDIGSNTDNGSPGQVPFQSDQGICFLIL